MINSAPPPTPAPMPAFAPVLSPPASILAESDAPTLCCVSEEAPDGVGLAAGTVVGAAAVDPTVVEADVVVAFFRMVKAGDWKGAPKLVPLTM